MSLPKASVWCVCVYFSPFPHLMLVEESINYKTIKHYIKMIYIIVL